MGTLNEDLSSIKEVEDKIVANKVARFAYTNEAYKTNDADGVDEYDVDNAQNIPTADASVLKVNETVLSKGYRAQASSITRMLVNHFFGRMSYNLNKVNDNVSNLIATLIGHRGTANGFATLDENGRVPYSQLPESAMEYKGQWNAETNTPALADGTGTKGDFYIVSVSGTQNLGSGNVHYFENDRIIYDGSVWSRLSAGDVKAVNSVLPANGNVALTGEDIPVSPTDPTLLSAPLTTDRYADSSVTTEKIADNAVTNAKIKEPISVTKGGTGQTTATDAANAFINSLELGNAVPKDEDYYVCQWAGGNSETPVHTTYTRRPISKLWDYIKDKISSVLGLTTTQYNGNANTATTAESANKIEPIYTTNVELSEVASTTTKYIKIADCSVGQTGTLQVYLRGDSFIDTLVINFGAGNASTPMLCGYYHGNSHMVLSVIAQNGSAWNSDYSIYVKIRQATNCSVRVALLKGDCTINITDSITAPTNISEWAVNYGLFGNLTGNATTADKVKNALTINGQSFDGSSPVTLNISSGTDTKVYQNVSTNNNTYPILASDTANKSYSDPGEAIISNLLRMNPSTGNMTGWSNGSAYAICATDSSVSEKDVELTGLTLTSGMTVTVLFINGNNAVAPILNVNSSGAKQIKVYLNGGKTIVTTQWDAGTSMTLMYDGEDFVVLGNPVVMSKLGETSSYIKYANGLLIQWGRSEAQYVSIVSYSSVNSYKVFSHAIRKEEKKHYDNEIYFAYTERQIYIPKMMDGSISVEYLTIGY